MAGMTKIIPEFGIMDVKFLMAFIISNGSLWIPGS